MWGNYLTVGFRALTKNRTYAFINIFGLALGLAAALLLLLYVRYETTYDSWLPDAGRVFQVQTFGTDPTTGADLSQQGVTRPVSDALAKDFPQIEAISKFEGDEPVLLKDGQVIQAERGYAADPTFFDIIQLPFLQGDRRTALRAANSVVLSRSEAIRLFGTPRALGRTLTQVRDGEKRDLRVTGVFRDLPRNSHMGFTFVRRFNSGEEEDCSWGCVNGMSYVKLRPGVEVETIHSQMPAWERRNVPDRDVGGSDIRASTDWRLVNVRDVHLGPAGNGDRPGNDRATLTTFTIVAMLILGMAIVNFVNLATARAGQRAREVAVRKVLGARRTQLIGQFLGESMLLVALAMLIALALLELTLPAFSAYLGVDLGFDYLGEKSLTVPIVGLTLTVGLLGGLYPAFALSRYQPAAILKANQSSTDAQGSGRLRSGLVIAQFAVSIGLIACTAIVYHQTLFARSADPGYQREGLLTIAGLNNLEVRRAREAFAREVAKVPGVTGVAASKIVPADGPTFFTTVAAPGHSEPVKLGWYSVEPSFFGTMKIDTLAGRTLSPAFANDKIFIDIDNLAEAAIEPAARALASRGMNVVLNRSAARQLGFADPQTALGKQIGIPAFGEEIGPVPATIVGVVKDTRFRSVREQIEPIIFYDDGFYRYLVARFEGADPAAVRAGVERAWRRLFPETPFEAGFADQQLADLYGADEARGETFAGFALLAIVIACLGLFGLAAFTAERRTKEIGIRKVFGATVADIVKLLAWQFSKPVVLANLIAWPVAWWVMRDWLNTFDARIALTPGPFLLAGALALVIAIGTIAGHAVRVARTNPIHALRYE
jgi:putative ABC transport system permease protein